MNRHGFGLHFPVTVLHFCKTLLKIYINCSPLSHRRRGPDPVSQIVTDPPAKIQAKAAGLFVTSAVIAGIALFKDPGNILRGNADTVIPDTETLFFFSFYRNFSLGTGIF